MSSEKEQQLATKIADAVAEKLAQQLTDLKLTVEAIKQLMHAGSSGGSKKATKSKKNEGKETEANGTAESKTEAKGTKTMNSMNYFKDRFMNDKEIKEKYWVKGCEEEFLKDSDAKKSFDKAKGDEAKDKVRAGWYWKVKKTDALSKEWAAKAKAAGGGKSGDSTQLEADDK